ncbi:MAG: hydroxymethylbilane synthase [Bacteriovoracaceae bacterium]|nr:hydroxymethylbilane synthase [Bacteriovoracaceae bacterium]
MSNQNYLIGTRGSLLAVTQCTLLKEEIESKTNASFDLRKIKTEGDQKTEKPLWQLDGKDFFTKELDAALLNDEIDLVVHSYKDLGSERPEGLRLAAVGERRFAHDILLIKKETISQIKTKDKFIVGTSSPRRITNVERSLKPFLPKASKDLKVECKMLRGNVNTRIQKLVDGDYDAIVLALAGLERLANKKDSAEILKELLKDLTFLVMPQKTFPSSASQGALAVEVHDKSPKLDEIQTVLNSIHCPDTVEAVKRERTAFVGYGGGCHLAVGIHVKKHKDLFIHIHKGTHKDQIIDKVEVEGQNLDKIKGKKTFLAIGRFDKLVTQTPLEVGIPQNNNLFVTSQYCIDHLEGCSPATIWAAGSRTHKKLADAGHWVNGSADSFGHEEVLSLSSSKAIQMMLTNDDWKTLSHDNAQSPVGEVIGCYTRKLNEQADIDLTGYEVFYWGSFYQYTEYVKRFPEIKNKIHACGLGKTYDSFKNNNIDVLPIADMGTFKDLVDTKENA